MNLERRELRALGIVVKGGQVQRVDDTLFLVKSQSGPKQHNVKWSDGNWKCGCEDFLLEGRPWEFRR